jgi:hypothetical protein
MTDLPFDVRFPDPPSEQPTDSNSPEGFPLTETWYYYLTEIFLRCVFDRILDTFYSQNDDRHWLQYPPDQMLQSASELENQLLAAISNLPPEFQYEQPDQELSRLTSGRIMHTQEFLFRPFLYRVVHSLAHQVAMIQDLAQRCVQVCQKRIYQMAIQHRHHGSWMVAMAVFRCGLSIVAAAKSGRVDLPADWRHCVETAIAVIEFWSEEADDLKELGVVFRGIYTTV